MLIPARYTCRLQKTVSSQLKGRTEINLNLMTFIDPIVIVSPLPGEMLVFSDAGCKHHQQREMKCQESTSEMCLWTDIDHVWHCAH